MCHLAQRQDPRWAAHASVQPHKRHAHPIHMHTVCMCMCKCLYAACPMMCPITLAHSAAARLHICSRSEPHSRAASGIGGAIGLPWPCSLPRSPQDAHAQIACRHSRHHSSGCPTAVLVVVQPQSSMQRQPVRQQLMLWTRLRRWQLLSVRISGGGGGEKLVKVAPQVLMLRLAIEKRVPLEEWHAHHVPAGHAQ